LLNIFLDINFRDYFFCIYNDLKNKEEALEYATRDLKLDIDYIFEEIYSEDWED
jgi:hypothetical protein